MGQVRHRDSAEIRTRALDAAAKKYADGCAPCAASYLALARQHGATERETAAFRIPSTADRIETEAGRGAINRRKLLQLAATVVAAGFAGRLAPRLQVQAIPSPLPPPNEAADEAVVMPVNPPVPGAFGVDSCTSVAHGTVAQMPVQFYIGELGATKWSAGCFDAAIAAHVTSARTHGYWGVCGPNSRLTGVVDAAAFGAQQAHSALEAWNSNPAVGGRTIFADVESGFGGWGAPATIADNVALLDAFLRTIAQAGFVPGVYINRTEKLVWFPATYVADVPFVYWVAGGRLAGAMPAPCGPGDTLHAVYDAWMSDVRDETFGGMRAVVWQYWLSGMGCAGDFDYSPQSGAAIFTPALAP
jgi:hypothetical protein